MAPFPPASMRARGMLHRDRGILAACMRDFLRLWFLLSMVWIVGCSGGGDSPDTSSSSASSSSSAGSSSSGSADGGPSGPCGVDCSALQTGKCQVGVCNTGQVAGPLNTCIVIPAPDGMACDDGLFCTTNDACDKGTCVGGPPNDCGMVTAACSATLCDEAAKSCSVVPVKDGTTCAPADLCQVNGTCQASVCAGQPKDCSFSPLSECNKVACDSSTGECTGTPDPTQDGTPCALTGDLCSVDKACSSGQCMGGTPLDCSGLTAQCQVGTCDSTTGLCGTASAPVGTVCIQGVQECQVGACNTMGTCAPSTAPDGTACNDHAACTQTDTCTAGACAGLAVAGCKPYFSESFETCPDGWTLGGDWQCGTPTSASPVKPHGGHGVLATQLDGLYHNNQSFDTCTADSPPIDLTHATNPMVSFWAWVHTEGGTFDGWNLSVSTDGGQTFPEVMKVTPAYPLNIAGLPAWGGDLSALGWQLYSADLTAYAGHSIILRYAFRSDPAGGRPGVYIDDLLVAEPVQIPLYITTPSPLKDVYAEQDYSATIAKIGGASDSVWSIDPGGVNDAWLQINAATGVLSGRPSAAQTGPVSFTVRVEEPSLPSNFAEQTYTFVVKPDAYYTSWEGTCPGGWTLTGDWSCGVPTNTLGPATASNGTQCIGTGIAGDYNNNDAWAATTATSPEIDLVGTLSPTLTFRMWIDTEGFTYDGANLSISDDGGTTYAVLNTVTPAYGLMVGGEPAWGGNQGTSGWQLVQADLTAYANKMVYLQFGFRSDVSNTYAGVFIDDFLVE